mmetsp:Transcript_19489/g.30025  ORF Transcript_19489/g.30025 Transcript_19489/m.30025 type:complete len:461 (-) Transcript_19489:35-1417(-)|eukprot:CAMPEP_0196804678 /NCGR_PEP_ID=MMETSP1362-20130617/4338_1 /TAXON_ID=163516 /ORGANISM="Leptocylindrus danicus, Strain CCMP1856" /LENGTH=460 /DNA_ID=CAMNT_0042177135 /DNA_START=115 /DNA_END=1497 /DNA_ORIENTATION=-
MMKTSAQVMMASLLSVLSAQMTSAFAPLPFCANSIRAKHNSRFEQQNSQRHMIDDPTKEPLADGIDSVSWLPSVKGTSSNTISAMEEEAEILPFFPLGGIVYTPHSQHVLNIFEPRYRKMYNDILMNGSKRFVVAMAHPNEEGRFAETGVIFYLDDLREVSEMTADQIKYICSHKVTGRAKIHRVINPEVWETREDYMRVEATLMEEEDGESDDVQIAAIPEEEQLKNSYGKLVDLQHTLNEDVRFTKASVGTLCVNPGGGDDCLWSTVRLWQTYIEQRLNARQNEMQKEFQEKLIQYLMKEKNVDQNELPSAIGFTDLSPSLQKEVTDLQQRMAVELEPLVLESTLSLQKILETDEHKGRVNLVKFFVDAERKRLEARKMLQSMFGTTTTTTDEDMIPLSEATDEDGDYYIYTEEELIGENDDDDDDSNDDGDGDGDGDDDDSNDTPRGSIFADDNAFQ